MKSNLTLIFLLITVSYIFGQPKITEKRYQTFNSNIGEWVVQNLEQTDYDLQERPILHNEYYRNSSGLINSYRTENTYTDENRIRTSSKWSPSADDVLPFSMETWEYDATGCTEKRIYQTIEHESTANDKMNKSTYVYWADAPPCTVKEELFSVFIPELYDDFVKNAKYVYSYEDDFKIEKKECFIWSEITQSWNLFQLDEMHQDANGNMVLRKVSGTNGLSSETIWEYNDSGRLVQVDLKQYEDGVLTNSKITNFDYELDEQDFVVKKVASRVESSYRKELSYENYCDGLARIEKELNNNTLSFKKTHFEYLQGTDCEEPKENLHLTLYPNPTDGHLTLQSELLYAAATQVQILNMAGQKLRIFDVPGRIEKVEIQVKDLPVGSYVVRVIAAENAVAEKLMVLK